MERSLAVDRSELKMAVGTYQSVLVPLNTGLLVGVGVGVALGGASLTAEETVEVGADLVGTAGLGGVALGATGLKEREKKLLVSCSLCMRAK